jgi:hypothetical protein
LSDTCRVRIRIHPMDEPAVVDAFGTEPTERHDLDDGTGCILVFDYVEPDQPLAELARRRITFEGRHRDGIHYPGRLFASQSGELQAIGQPFDVISVPIDLETLRVDDQALNRLRSYKSLSTRVQEELDHRLPVEIAIGRLKLEEVGDVEPWHRMLGSLSIAGVYFHIDATAVERSPAEGGVQEAVASDLRRSFALAAEGLSTDTGFQTLKLTDTNGQAHEYVVFIYPCDS